MAKLKTYIYKETKILKFKAKNFEAAKELCRSMYVEAPGTDLMLEMDEKIMFDDCRCAELGNGFRYFKRKE